MKTKFLPAVSPRAARKGLLSRLQTRMYRLPAHVTREDDWKADSPNIKLSRVFGIVLGIHLVAIGGLMTYEMFRHKDGADAGTTVMKPAARDSRPSSPNAPQPTAPRTQHTVLDDPANTGLATHVVGPGEKLSDIAGRFQVEETALIEKNRISQDHPFESGMKLVIPKPSRALTSARNPEELLAASSSSVPTAKDPVPVRSATPVSTLDPAGNEMVPVAPFSPDKPVRRAEPVGPSRAADTPPTAKTAAPPARMAAVKKPETAAKKPTSPRTAQTAPPAKGRVHVVKEGETAYRIARKYGVDLDQLVRTNGIKPDALRPGSTLAIPAAR